jgi:thiamine phosphate synthase YjbQ (UPF0047 family)
MRIETTRLTVATDEGISIDDITSDVDAFVRATGIESGLCVMTVARDAAFLSLAPDLDDAFDDLLRLARSQRGALGPSDPFPAAVETGATADRSGSEPVLQVAPGVLADCLSLAVTGGEVQIGNWDAIVLIDTDGPRVCAIDVTLMGSARD